MSGKYDTPLDEQMDRRRVELGMKWRDVAREAKVSYEALRAARAGEGQPAALTKRGIERALRWRPGSVDLILAGDPSPMREQPQADETEFDDEMRQMWEDAQNDDGLRAALLAAWRLTHRPPRETRRPPETRRDEAG